MPDGYLLISTLFIGYFALHSLFASLWFKRWATNRIPALTPYYRLLFNTLAVVLFLPLVWAVWHYSPGETLWQWQGVWFYIANALGLLAAIAFLFSLRMYDMSEFMGMRQLREQVQGVKDQEHFKISLFHRFVRHPWYTMLLVLIWTRDMTTISLLVYGLITLYLIIGSKLEERKLIAFHGDVYRRYRKRVAGLVPLPWKILGKGEAQRLLEEHEKRAG